MSDLMKVGADWGGAGAFKPLTSSISGSQRVSDAHGRFMEAALANRLFHGGAGIVAIANATFTTATLGVTATPVIGLWNPLTSRVNAIVLQAQLSVIMTALQATGPGGFAWATSQNNGAISTGSTPFNAYGGAAVGAQAKFFAGAALTGMSNNLVVMRGSALGGGSAVNAAFLATQVALQTQALPTIENFDGAFIVPPGGVLALLATTTPVAHSVVPGITWEEVPLLVTV